MPGPQGARGEKGEKGQGNDGPMGRPGETGPRGAPGKYKMSIKSNAYDSFDFMFLGHPGQQGLAGPMGM